MQKDPWAATVIAAKLLVVPVAQSSFAKNLLETAKLTAPKVKNIKKEMIIPKLNNKRQQLIFFLPPTIPLIEIRNKKSPKRRLKEGTRFNTYYRHCPQMLFFTDLTRTGV